MDRLLEILLSRLGSILTPLIAAGVGAGIAALAKRLPMLSEALSGIDQAELTVAIVVAIVSIVTALVNRVTSEGAKEVQRKLNALGADIRVDGVIRKETLTALRDKLP